MRRVCKSTRKNISGEEGTTRVQLIAEEVQRFKPINELYCASDEAFVR